jgi:hypothetical protein
MTCEQILYSMNAFKPPSFVPFDGSSTLQENGGSLGLIFHRTEPLSSLYFNDTIVNHYRYVRRYLRLLRRARRISFYSHLECNYRDRAYRRIYMEISIDDNKWNIGTSLCATSRPCFRRILIFVCIAQ